jgi:transcriptional regulator with XRE-family HTH domain
MIQGNHIRAARALLGWTREKLCEESGVSVQTIKRLEIGGPEVSKYKTVKDVTEALERAGITFMPGGPQLSEKNGGNDV